MIMFSPFQLFQDGSQMYLDATGGSIYNWRNNLSIPLTHQKGQLPTDILYQYAHYEGDTDKLTEGALTEGARTEELA
jgi:hypothetical protein